MFVAIFTNVHPSLPPKKETEFSQTAALLIILPRPWILAGWWFQRFFEFSISYMGCHPSH